MLKESTLILFLIMLTGCSTIIQKYDSKEKYVNSMIFTHEINKIPVCTFIIKQDGKGNRWGEITSPLLNNSVIKGSLINHGESIEIMIESLYFFSSWYNGWTEGKAGASGRLLLKKVQEGYEFERADDFELMEITEGSIRYFDDYYRNEEGLRKVRERINRIFSVVEFLKKDGFPDHFDNFLFESEAGDSFKNNIQPFLFPEISTFKKDKTGKYSLKMMKADSIRKYDWTIGFDMMWDRNYSREVFPANLREIRNSGSMWRDYEESRGLYFMAYNMNYFFDTAIENFRFKRIK